MSESNPIIELSYKMQFFDVSELKIGYREVTTIYDFGYVEVHEYKPRIRKPIKSQHAVFPTKVFKKLCDKIEQCISTANRCDLMVDDCSGEMKIKYLYGREQIVDRGLGNENEDIY